MLGQLTSQMAVSKVIINYCITHNTSIISAMMISLFLSLLLFFVSVYFSLQPVCTLLHCCHSSHTLILSSLSFNAAAVLHLLQLTWCMDMVSDKVTWNNYKYSIFMCQEYSTIFSSLFEYEPTVERCDARQLSPFLFVFA